MTGRGRGGRPDGGPPRGWEALLATLLHPGDRDAAVGDLAEDFRDRVRAEGRGAARRWYRSQVLRSVVPALRTRWERGSEASGLGSAAARIAADARHALRGLRTRPGFAAAVLLTLGLGIGASTAVFAVVEGVLLRPLPWGDSEPLLLLTQERGEASFWVSAPNYQDWREGLDSFEEIAAYTPDGANAVVEDEPVRVATAEVTANFFTTLGVEPVVGRSFTEEERRAGERVAVVTHGLWQARFAGRPALDGASLTLDGATYRIVGVLPPGTAYPADTEVWIPISLDAPEWRTRRGIGWILVLGRLRPEAGPEAAEAEMDALGAALQEAYPDENEDMGIGAEPLRETLLGDVRRPLEVLLAAVLLVLAVACVNVAGLVLARATTRRREMAIRTALGAGRGRLTGQLLVESLVVGGLGALVGLLVARAGVAGLLRLAPPGTPRIDEVGLGWPAFAFAAAAALAAAVVTGLFPALRLSRRAPLESLGGRGDGEADRGAGALRKVLVVGQIGLALALVAGSGHLIESFWRLGRVDPGFDPEGVLTARLPVVESDFASTEERVAYYLEMDRRARALPGVLAAGLVNAVPMQAHGPTFSYELREPPAEPGDDLLARYRVVTPGVFDALGLTFVAGRGFTPDEAAPGGPRAIVVDRELAEAHFPDGDALGREIGLLDEWWRIVGVVAPVRASGLRGAPNRHLFLPLARASRQTMSVVIRTGGDPLDWIAPLRQTVRDVAPHQPLTDVTPLATSVWDSVADTRFTLWVLGFFAAATLLLASVGIYGLLAYTVQRRTREIGVRMALGAGRGAVRRMVVTEALVVAGTGLGLGLWLAWVGTPHLGGLLYEVEPRDPRVMGGVAAVLAVVAVLAAWMPARRATRVAPSEALRSE